MSEAKTLVPELRFPEFETNWSEKRFGELFNHRQEKGGENLPLLSLTAEEGIIPQTESGRKDNSNADKSRYLKIAKGDIAYNTMRMWEGRSALSELEGLVSPAYTICAPKKGSHSKFFSYYIKTPLLIEQFNRNSQGLTKDTYSLKFSSFSRIKVLRPTEPEQQKIADCLGSLDDLIAAHRRKLDALQDHKKGLLQNLFPTVAGASSSRVKSKREQDAPSTDETTPKLRFPGFEGEWTSEKLIKYFPKIRNGFVGTASPYYIPDGVPYLQGKNIKKGRIDATGLIRINHEFHAKQKKSQLKEGDILMVQSGHVGECAVVGKDFHGGNCHALIVLSPSQKTSSEFFKHFFYSPTGQALISKVKTGNTIAHILATDLRVMLVQVPTPQEQQKIADCLSALDALITAQTEQIAALKAHKKGLMQKLFPTMN